jgi:ABC-type transport system substrate-binding protein
MAAELIAGQLAQLGITVEVQPLAYQGYLDRLASGGMIYT